jgi:ABC-type amino acid transport substrate-binding protein
VLFSPGSIPGPIPLVVQACHASRPLRVSMMSRTLALLREPFTIEPLGIAAPPGDALLVNYLENAMDALEASGFLSAIRTRWLERSDWVQQLP